MRKLLLNGVAMLVGVAGLAVLAPASPAHAATATTTTLSAYKSHSPYGYSLSLSGHVQTTSGGMVETNTGTLYLQIQKVGSKTWKTVSTSHTDDIYYYGKFRGNDSYRLVFGSSTQYSTSTSKTLKLHTTRKVTYRDVSKGRPRVKVKATPQFHHKKFTVRVKKGKHYRPYSKVKSNKAGVAIITLRGSNRGILYKITANSGKRFDPTSIKIRARSYHY